MMTTKTIRTVLATVGVALLLTAAGCGGGATTTTNTTSPATTNTTTAEPNTTTSPTTTTTTTAASNTTTMETTKNTTTAKTTTKKPGATAAVKFQDQRSNGSNVTVKSVTLSKGGFVAIHAVKSDSVLGYSKYLSAGTHKNVNVTFNQTIQRSRTLVATVHKDTNGNHQFDYPRADGSYKTANGDPVEAKANVTVA